MGCDREKWCDYHRIKGHDTSNCWTLRAHMDKMIEKGYGQKPSEGKRQCRPKDFIWSSDQSPDRDREKPEEIRGTISTIAGGFIGGGTSSSSRRRYARSVMTINTREEDHPQMPVISFSNADFEVIKSHRDDPMVIQALMASFMVKRILVDQGSSTDILYWEAFQKLGLSPELLLPFSGSLIGFVGESVEVRGEEVLLIELEFDSWMGPIDIFIETGRLPEDEREAKKVRSEASEYTLINGRLYKRGITLPLLRCLTKEQGAQVIREIH
ncbi:hypothetical protein SESBI_44085 [Sesbania bispinosa]|nr:hypothetical protein SESBI_44085 [Sesbania bispinosa]